MNRFITTFTNITTTTITTTNKIIVNISKLILIIIRKIIIIRRIWIYILFYRLKQFEGFGYFYRVMGRLQLFQYLMRIYCKKSESIQLHQPAFVYFCQTIHEMLIISWTYFSILWDWKDNLKLCIRFIFLTIFNYFQSILHLQFWIF